MVDNPLLSNPFFSQPSEPQGGVKPLDLDRRVTALTEEKPEPTYGDIGTDVGRSTVSGAGKGIYSTLKGGLGSVETFFGKDVPELGRSLAGGLAEYTGKVTPERRAQIESEPLIKNLSEEQQQGMRSPFLNLPTYKSASQEYAKKAKETGYDILAHEPTTIPGKIASTGAEMAAQGIPGAIRTAIPRMALSYAAGVGSELGAQTAGEGSESEPWMRLVGSLGGMYAGAKTADAIGAVYNGIKALALPTGVASNQIAEALALDASRGQLRMTPQQLLERQRSGTPVTVLDMGGPELDRLAAKASDLNPQTRYIAAEYNDFLKNRAAETGQRLSENFSRVMGTEINAPNMENLVEKAGRETRDKIYTILKSEPSAQNIDHFQFGDLLTRPTFQKAMQDAAQTAREMPHYNIVPPTFDKAGNTIQNGNLAYWDQVKRHLDDSISFARGQRLSEPERIALDARKSLLNNLDATVPGYSQARNIAAETFGAASAPEAGYKFFDNMSAFKRDDLLREFNKMTPAQQDLFRVGYMHRLDEIARQGNVGSLAKKFTSDANFQQRTLDILGGTNPKDPVAAQQALQRYQEIKNSVVRENVLSKVKELQFLQQSPYQDIAGPSATAAGLVAGTEAMFGAQAFALTPELAAKAAIGAAVTGAGKYILNAVDRRVLEKALPMALSSDPNVVKRFSQLSLQSPEVDSAMRKLTLALSSATVAHERGVENVGKGPEESAGGRIGRASGGSVVSANKADQLIKAAENAKKAINSRTEVLLDQPDEKIAGALAIAKRHI
jgi:hypothetical protein